MQKLLVIKIGGNVIDDEVMLHNFLSKLASVHERKILIHGGGKLATTLAEQLQVKQQMINGRRVTNAETLKIVTMVYAGYINKNIVAKLQANNCNAAGFTGVDANCISAHKRTVNDNNIDYGFAGDIDSVNNSFFISLLQQDITLVVAPITADNNGQLLNTNADTIAQELAKSLSNDYDVELIYCFEKPGVLKNVEDDKSVIGKLNHVTYQDMVADQSIHSGMIPKLDNAFSALKAGVKKVVIGQAQQIDHLINCNAGTTISL